MDSSKIIQTLPTMKSRFFIISTILCVFCLSSLFAQDLTKLSNEGYGHWTAAGTLLSMAKTGDDYQQVANELEKVIQTDPNFEDTYFNLVKVYEQIGVEKGSWALAKAKKYLEEYKRMRPDDSRTVESELIVLQALEKKSKQNIVKRFVGKWQYMGLYIVEGGGGYSATVESTDKYSREVCWIRVEDDHMVLLVKETYDGIAYGALEWDRAYKKYQNHIIERKGRKYWWTKEVDYNKYMIWNENGTNFISLIHYYDEYYSQKGLLVYYESGTYNKDQIKSELKH